MARGNRGGRRPLFDERLRPTTVAAPGEWLDEAAKLKINLSEVFRDALKTALEEARSR